MFYGRESQKKLLLNMIKKEDKTGLSCYKYGFISKSGFHCEPADNRILISLRELYQ